MTVTMRIISRMFVVASLLAFVFACEPADTPVQDEPVDPDPGQTVPGPVTPDPDFESVYEKQIALWEFTGAWCANCPAGYTNMNFLLQTNPQFGERVHLMAFHSNYSGEDDLAIEETDQIMIDVNVSSLGFPSYIVDMSLGGSLVESVNLKEHLVQTLEDNPCCCGVAVASSISEGKASVDVRLHSEVDAGWRVAVYVVEDKIKYYQLDGMKKHDQYTHRHVVRRIVSTSYRGDRIGSATIAAGTEVTSHYDIPVDDRWDTAETYVYVLALDADGSVNNMNCCLLDGGNADYIRK